MTTMSVQTFKNVAQRLPADASILLRGDHGIGKSQIVRQVAAAIAANENIVEYEVIDRRLSQMSEGDMIGLPSTDGKVTRFNPPDWYKRACEKPCLLFLDELNRATREITQAAFQIVLDRELNGWKLHPQTRVFSAVNTGSAYTVNEIDPALLDRFWAIDLKPDTNDWLTWAREGDRIDPTIVDYIASDDRWLDPPKNADFNEIHPSRRSWERLSIALTGAQVNEKPDDPLFYSMCLGFIGLEATIAFHGFAKSVDNRVSGEDILNDYTKAKKKVARLGQERLNIAIDKVAEYVSKNVDKALTDKQGKNLKAFMKDLTPELRIACWAKLTSCGIDKLDLARSIHKYCAEDVLSVFGVPMGKEGIGVVPNIPGIFQPKADKK